MHRPLPPTGAAGLGLPLPGMPPAPAPSGLTSGTAAAPALPAPAPVGARPDGHAPRLPWRTGDTAGRRPRPGQARVQQTGARAALGRAHGDPRRPQGRQGRRAGGVRRRRPGPSPATRPPLPLPLPQQQQRADWPEWLSRAETREQLACLSLAAVTAAAPRDVRDTEAAVARVGGTTVYATTDGLGVWLPKMVLPAGIVPLPDFLPEGGDVRPMFGADPAVNLAVLTGADDILAGSQVSSRIAEMAERRPWCRWGWWDAAPPPTRAARRGRARAHSRTRISS